MSFVSGVVDSVGAYTLIRVTWPVVELRQRDRRRSEPPLPGSTILSKLFPHCKSYSMHSGLVRCLPLPKEYVALLLLGAIVCKPFPGE